MRSLPASLRAKLEGSERAGPAYIDRPVVRCRVGDGAYHGFHGLRSRRRFLSAGPRARGLMHLDVAQVSVTGCFRP